MVGLFSVILLQWVQRDGDVLHGGNGAPGAVSPGAAGGGGDVAGAALEPPARRVLRRRAHLQPGRGRGRFCKCPWLLFLYMRKSLIRSSAQIKNQLWILLSNRTLRQLPSIVCIHKTEMNFKLKKRKDQPRGFLFDCGKLVTALVLVFPPLQGYGFQPQYNGDELSCTLRNLKRSTSYKFRVRTIFCF